MEIAEIWEYGGTPYSSRRNAVSDLCNLIAPADAPYIPYPVLVLCFI